MDDIVFDNEPIESNANANMIAMVQEGKGVPQFESNIENDDSPRNGGIESLKDLPNYSRFYYMQKLSCMKIVLVGSQNFHSLLSCCN